MDYWIKKRRKEWFLDATEKKKEEKEKRGGKQKGEAEAAVGLMADYKDVNVAISESWMWLSEKYC